MVDVHRRLAFFLGLRRLFLQFLRLGHDLFLLLLVPVDFLLISRLLLAGGQRGAELGQILLRAFGLVEIPPIRRSALRIAACS
jgi:hypothetical protein